jgi:[ribosomal protein S5]-alanine N-acetyltransferase
MKLLTHRLELVPVTLAIIEADLHRRDELPALVDAEIAEEWPPPLVDVAAMQRHKQALVNDPDLGPWTSWYWITRKPRMLMGMSGFKSRPKDGVVEIGYSVVPAFQRCGFGTEAVIAMVEFAFANGVDCIAAETLPELVASQRLLLKCGFNFCGEGSEPGVIRFERRR